MERGKEEKKNPRPTHASKRRDGRGRFILPSVILCVCARAYDSMAARFPCVWFSFYWPHVSFKHLSRRTRTQFRLAALSILVCQRGRRKRVSSSDNIVKPVKVLCYEGGKGGGSQRYGGGGDDFPPLIVRGGLPAFNGSMKMLGLPAMKGFQVQRSIDMILTDVIGKGRVDFVPTRWTIYTYVEMRIFNILSLAFSASVVSSVFSCQTLRNISSLIPAS